MTYTATDLFGTVIATAIASVLMCISAGRRLKRIYRRSDVKMTNLRDTVTLMNSNDYKDRFIAEYWQTKIRYEKLKAFNTKIEAADMKKYDDVLVKVERPKVLTPYHILKEQQKTMGEYLHLLELRAVFEDIDLDMIERCRDDSPICCDTKEFMQAYASLRESRDEI